MLAFVSARTTSRHFRIPAPSERASPREEKLPTNLHTMSHQARALLRPRMGRRLPPSCATTITTTTVNPTGSRTKLTRPITTTPPPSFTSTAAQVDPPTSSPKTLPNPPPSPPTKPTPLPTKPLSDSVRQLLPFLRAQPARYITVHIHGFPYLVTAGDLLRLPTRIPGVIPGDVLRLDRASVLGSRDYTLRGSPFIDERLFVCRATVVGVDAEPMRVEVKKKQRCRRTKTVRNKMRFTVMRISEVKVRSVEEVEALAGEGRIEGGEF